MWAFIFSVLLLRRMGLSKPIRYVLAVLMIGLLIVVLIYTACLFLTLEERKSAPYAATYSIY
jgi:hypothetical protein